MFKIYLAGAMSNVNKYERNKWRESIEKYFKENSYYVTIINPCKFYDIDTVDYSVTTEKEIKEFDLYHVRTSDLIIVNLTHPNSIGTAMELQVACDMHKPIISFGISKIPIHPWIEETITKKCISIEDALDYVTKFYLRR